MTRRELELVLARIERLARDARDGRRDCAGVLEEIARAAGASRDCEDRARRAERAKLRRDRLRGARSVGLLSGVEAWEVDRAIEYDPSGDVARVHTTVTVRVPLRQVDTPAWIDPVREVREAEVLDVAGGPPTRMTVSGHLPGVTLYRNTAARLPEGLLYVRHEGPAGLRAPAPCIEHNVVGCDVVLCPCCNGDCPHPVRTLSSERGP